MSATLQARAALVEAVDTRARIGVLKADLRAGRRNLTEIMRDPPPELENVLLADLLRWVGTRSHRNSSRVRTLGTWAVRDKVNLMQTVGQASSFTRAWVAEHGLYQLRKDRWSE